MATILVAKLMLKEQFLTKATILLEVCDFFCNFAEIKQHTRQ